MKRAVWLRAAMLLWAAAMAIGSHWPRLNFAALIGRNNDDFAFGLDKWVHVWAYFGLAVWVLSAWVRPARASGAKRPALLILVMVAWAGIDELTEGLVPGREVAWADFCASSIGIGLGSILWGSVAALSGRHDGSFVAHSRVVSALTLLSRMFGLVRDAVLGRVFGLSNVFDAFTLAFMVPNLFRRLFGEGALSAAFIPLYSRINRSDPAMAQRFAAMVVGLLLVGLGALSLLIALALAATGGLLHLDDRGELVVRLTAVTILYTPLICAAAVLGGLLQVHGRFGITAASPILLNIFLIAAAAGGYWVYGAQRIDRVAMLVAIAVVVSGFIQVIWTLWGLGRAGVRPIQMVAMVTQMPAVLESAELRQSLRRLWSTTWPTALGLAVFQINSLADVLIAWFFSATQSTGPMMRWLPGVAYPMKEGAVAALGRAQLLYEFPHGVFGIAVATAIFPALARASHDRAQFSAFLRQGLRLAVFIGLPASIGLILVRQPLCRAIFFPGGQLTEEDATRIAWVLLGYAPAIWAYSTNMILTRAFYAQGNTLTPMHLSVAMVGLNFLLNLTLIWPLAEGGLAWATAICAIVQTLVLLGWVRRYAQSPLTPEVLGSWGRTALVTALMSAAVWFTLRRIDILTMDRLHVIAALLGVCGLGALVVAIGAAAMRMPELRWLVRGR